MKTLVEPVVPRALELIATPLISGAWRVEFAQYPDSEFVTWVVEGMERRVCIGYDYSRGVGTRAGKNMVGAGTPTTRRSVCWRRDRSRPYHPARNG